MNVCHMKAYKTGHFDYAIDKATFDTLMVFFS